MKVQKSLFSLLNFEILKFVETTIGRLLNSDVTFCSDTFSYKKLFHPTSYAKVMPVLWKHKVSFVKNIKIHVYYFSYLLDHIT
jgi:hypothetical protein